MATGVTTTVADTIFGVLTNSAGWTQYAELYLAPYNGDPTSGGTEITNTITGSANRIDLNMSTFNAPSTSGNYRLIDNASEISITASASAGATFDYVALYDVQTGGTSSNIVVYGALTTSKTVTTGDEVKIEAGELNLRVQITS